jgi:hypothetical protein
MGVEYRLDNTSSSGYSDFKTIVKSLSAGNTFYFIDTSANIFHICHISFGNDNFVTVSLNGTSTPSGFSTDFPNAILVGSRPENWGLV